jgi:hypothetical protein
MTEFQLVGVMFLVLPLILAGVIWAVNRRAHSIAANGYRTEATILSQEHISGEQGSWWRAHVRYTDYLGETHDKKLGVGSDKIVTETITVVYDTKSPKRVIVGTVATNLGTAMPTASKLMTFGLLGAMVILGIVFLITRWGEPL